MYELFKQVGYAAIIGLIVMIVFLPIAGMMTKGQIKYQKNAAQKTDRRVAAVNEFIQGIRVLKFFGWETNILQRLDAAREEELGWLRKYVILKSITFGTLMLVPLAVSITVFGVYVGTGGAMTPTVVFTAISLINVIRMVSRATALSTARSIPLSSSRSPPAVSLPMSCAAVSPSPSCPSP